MIRSINRKAFKPDCFGKGLRVLDLRITFLLKNLFHNKIRTALTLLGISVPAIPIFVQVGLYSAMMETAGIFYDQMKFDLAILSRDYLYFSKSGQFPENRIRLANSIDGIRETNFLRIGLHFWKNAANGDRREILVLGIDPQANPLQVPELSNGILQIKNPDTVIFDRFSQPAFGPRQIGTETELGPVSVEIVGQYSMGAGFSALGVVLVNPNTFDEIFGDRFKNDVSLGLLTLKEPQDAAYIQSELNSILPGDVQVVSREFLIRRERDYWTEATSLGAVLTVGLIVSFAVGVIVIYQILAADITNRITEYATLKAMGYKDRYLTIYLIQYAVGLCFLGFIPGSMIAWLIYQMIWKATRLPVEMTLERMILVLLTTVGMSICAGFFTTYKVFRADPADLFS